MMRRLHLGAIAALLLALLVVTGCGGGSNATSEQQQPSDTGTLTGRVLRADNVSLGLSSATVSVRAADGTEKASGTSGSNGSFSVTNVPVGQWQVVVETPNEPDYGSQTVPDIAITKGLKTSLTVTVLRATDPAPTAIYLSPTQAKVDLHGQVDFIGAVVSASGALTATPIYLVSSTIGTIDLNGKFTATATGKGQVTALCGDARVTAEVEVTAARPPEVTTFLVAPLKLKASGGTVTITIAANDGDGIKSVEAHIFTPGGEVTLPVPLASGTADTYRLTYLVPANGNAPDQLGNQAAQTYPIQVIVTDNTDVQTPSDWVDVTVEGLDAPPLPQ